MKNRLFSTQMISPNLVALLMRMILGGLFIFHGWQKIEAYDKILPMFTDIIGIGSKLSFNLVIFAEFFCGILLVIGLFTRLSVIPILFTMIIAYFVAHEADDFQKKTLPFLYMVLCIPVFFAGSGKYSVDSLIFRKKI